MSDYVIEEKSRVVMERQEPTFYSKIPKMATLELTPYELALYANYKQTASEEGKAWKSNKTLAKECKMSVRMVQECRKSLETKGYIHCTYKPNENGVVSSSVIVTIIDVWAKNHKMFSKKETTKQDTQPAQELHTPMQELHTPPAQGAYKEEPIKKNNNKKKDSSLDEPKKQAPKERDRLVEGVALVCFGIKYEDENQRAAFNANIKRIGLLVKYLKSVSATPESLWAFKLWYCGKYPDTAIPQAEAKFTKHYNDYLNSSSNGQVSNEPITPSQSVSASQAMSNLLENL